MANSKKIPWYKDPKIIIPAIIPLIAVIIGALFTIWMKPRESDFRISVNPLTGQTYPGGIEQTMVNVKHIYKYKYPVTLSAGEHPTGLKVTFMPIGEPSRPYSSTMTVDVDSDVKEGAYTIEIIGIGGDGKEHSCKYILNVKSISVAEKTTEVTTEEETIPGETIETEEETIEIITEKTTEGKETGKIAFTSFHDGNFEIYIMNADGTEQTNLTNNPADDWYPAWSLNGKKITFYSNRDGNDEIYVMNVDGSEQINLTNNSADDYSPAWSPDGKKIAFTSNRDGNKEVYVMNADGSNQTNLSNNGRHDWYPTWSPDGKKIAFTSDCDETSDIYVMNADGSEQINLTNNPAIDDGPAWSTDGKKIAFYSDRDGNLEIYVMNADGSEQTRLTDNPADDLWPAWSPESK